MIISMLLLSWKSMLNLGVNCAISRYMTVFMQIIELAATLMINN